MRGSTSITSASSISSSPTSSSFGRFKNKNMANNYTTKTTNHNVVATMENSNNKYNNNKLMLSSSSSSTSFHGGHVWVRTDLVTAIMEENHNSNHNKQWKARKRSRQGDWGWCRAQVISKQHQQQPQQQSLPFSSSQVTLRKVSSSGCNTTKSNDNTKGKQIQITLLIDDMELAPPHLQNQTVSFSYNTLDGTVCVANAWWQTHNDKSNNSNMHNHDDDNREDDEEDEDDKVNHNHLPPDDLTQLEQLHEPAVVYCLQQRYQLDDIYTYTGKILLALNPFRSLTHLYTPETMKHYYQHHPHDNKRKKPHIYAIAQDAWSSLQQTGHNQSILVSGESGSGKTVTTKICLRYLTELSLQQQRSISASSSSTTSSSSSCGGTGGGGGVERQVLQSNPILESFGNARTVRNDNSSRFGKFIILLVSRETQCLVSASMETYLLEKVRLITQAPGERNYHVFYEILAGLPQAERRDLHIGNRTAKDFRMTAQSGTFGRRDGVEDRDTWKELLQALDTVGFPKEEQRDLFRVTCGLLHASNLTFSSSSSSTTHTASASGGNDDVATLDRTNVSLKHTTQLLGVEPEALNDSLTKCRIEARGEVLFKNLTITQAQKAIEALIKVTYGAVFEYIVRRINESIRGSRSDDNVDCGGDGGGRPGDVGIIHGQIATTMRQQQQIGILDIFGFESLETNSLEQLCINYCNEALQQQFNRFVFKLEQQEYQKEGIDWSFIEFPDNQDVLDLIERKHDGILSILDEQCRLARCTDATFARTVYDKCQGHARLEATAAQKAALCFAIQHYAGWVEYDTANFVEKSKDELPKEAVLLLESSSYPFLAQLGRHLAQASGGAGSSSNTTCMSSSSTVKGPGGKRQLQRANSSLLRDSVGTQFSSQLKVLRIRIEATEPHYVRCLKPNDNLVPHNFQPSVIADQLTCAGVLEAIRVSRVGFPHRYYHEHFVERYSLLARSAKSLKTNHQPKRRPVLVLQQKQQPLNAADDCRALVEQITPQLTQVLEAEQQSNDTSATSSPVKIYRGNEMVFLGMQMGISKVFMRRKAFEALEHLRSKKLENAATKIQAWTRMYLARMDYDVAICAIIIIQTFLRRAGAYRMVQAYRAHSCAVRIQAAWRASKARGIMRALRWSQIVDYSALCIQKTWRGFGARRIKIAAQWIAYWCQSSYRGSRARQFCAFLFLDRKARIIQHAYSKYRRSRFFRRFRRSIVTLQNRQRLRLARRELCRLRVEARDLTKVAAERDQYRKELEHLRKELEEAKKDSPANAKAERMVKAQEIKALRAEVDRLRMELEKAHRMSETKSSHGEVQFLLDELARREDHLTQLKREVESLRSKDDSLSLSLRSFTVEASPSSGVPRPTITCTIPSQSDHANTTSSSPLVLRGSPVRSDVSLFDGAVEEENRVPVPPFGRIERAEPDVQDPSLGTVQRHLFSSDVIEEDALEQLHNAIRQGSVRQFEHILKSSTEMCLVINQGDKYGRTALHLAALALRADFVEILISKGAVVNAQDDDGETPLHLAENPQVTELLLKKGRANPNIPNVDGICAIHLAVQRRDVDSVRLLIRHGADVNYADNIRWFTPLHLIALPARHSTDENPVDDARTRIAQLLCGSMGASTPDLDYQDSQSNAPLHYAVQLETRDICNLLDVFLDNGANPNITNERNQGPLHLLCHNGKLRNLGLFQDALHCMLHHGANPNLQSSTGCTALHLTLYHRDIDSAIQLVHSGAELHLKWRKPTRWSAFWNDAGSSEVLALDMVDNDNDIYRILSAIRAPSSWAPPRSCCMHCRASLGSLARATIHCHYCRRIICKACASTCLPSHYFPKCFGVHEPSWVCGICERILVARKEEISNGTPPTTALSFAGDDIPNLLSNDDPSHSYLGLDDPGVSMPNSSYGIETATSSYGFEGFEAASSSFDEIDGRSDLFAC